MTPPPEPSANVRRYRVIAVSNDQCVNTHGVQAIEDVAGALVYYGDHDAVVSKLQSRLAAASNLIAQWEQIGNAQRQLATTERDIGLRASLIAASNAWMSCADELKKTLEKTK